MYMYILTLYCVYMYDSGGGEVCCKGDGGVVTR